MKFRPLHDRVVVKRIEAEEKVSRRHHHFGHRQKKPSQGEVIAVGQAVVMRPASSFPSSAGRRPGAVRQMVGHRGQNRLPGTPDHEGVRHHGHHDEPMAKKEGCVTPTSFSRQRPVGGML